MIIANGLMTMMTSDVSVKFWCCHDDLAVTINDAGPWLRELGFKQNVDKQIVTHSLP